MEERKLGFDEEIYFILQNTFDQALIINDLAEEGSKISPETLKLLIIATNLQSIANTFLLADSKPEEVQVDYKQVALGLLGTKDFILNGIESVE